MPRRSGAWWTKVAVLLLGFLALPRPAAAQGWEVVGGSAGSALGLIVGATAGYGDDARLEELVVGAAVGSALGSAGGAWLAGHLAGDEPSALGALLGGAVGTIVAVGVTRALDDALGGDPSGVLFVGYTVSQGTVAGLASWMLGSGRSKLPDPDREG